MEIALYPASTEKVVEKLIQEVAVAIEKRSQKAADSIQEVAAEAAAEVKGRNNRSSRRHEKGESVIRADVNRIR